MESWRRCRFAAQRPSPRSGTSSFNRGPGVSDSAMAAAPQLGIRNVYQADPFLPVITHDDDAIPSRGGLSRSDRRSYLPNATHCFHGSNGPDFLDTSGCSTGLDIFRHGVPRTHCERRRSAYCYCLRSCPREIARSWFRRSRRSAPRARELIEISSFEDLHVVGEARFPVRPDSYSDEEGTSDYSFASATIHQINTRTGPDGYKLRGRREAAREGAQRGRGRRFHA